MSESDQLGKGVIRERLESTSESVLVVHPSTIVLKALIETITDHENPPPVQVLTGETVVKDVFSDFLFACHAADAVADDTLDLQIAETRPGNQLLITENHVTALVTTDDSIAGITTSDPATVETVTDHYTNLWEDTDPYSLRTPPLTRLLETLREEFNNEIADDFETVLNSANSIPRTGTDLDEVGVALLIAAKHGELLYDISKWGEDTGLASKATFSRTKTNLEDQGLIATEKVPIDIGRPRLRLLLADQELRDAPIEDLLTLARKRL